MKVIIEGKLYDTETAECILVYQKREVGIMPYYTTAELYTTKKGAKFEYVARNKEITLLTEEYVKKVLSEQSPDKYIEMFGEVEEG